MTTYNVWVGGDNSWNRSYGAEVGFLALTQAQINQWITDDIDDIDTEELSERVCSWDYSENPNDFPSRDEIENGCMGYGAYTDQTFGVSRISDEGEEEIIWTGNVHSLINVDDPEDAYAPWVNWTCEDPSMEFSENEYKPVPGIGYLNTHKGGWGSSFDLPDDEEFDVRKLRFNVLEVEGLCEIVTGFSYDEVDYYDDSDTDGKGCDIFLNVEGGYEIRLL